MKNFHITKTQVGLSDGILLLFIVPVVMFFFAFFCSETSVCNNGSLIYICLMLNGAGEVNLFTGCKQDLVYNPALNVDLHYQVVYNIR